MKDLRFVEMRGRLRAPQYGLRRTPRIREMPKRSITPAELLELAALLQRCKP